MKKVFIISGICLTIIIAIVFIVYKNNNVNYNNNYSKELNKLLNKKVKYGELLGISYSDSGDMRGNVDSVDIDVNKLLLISRLSDGMEDNILVTEYKISKDDIAYLENMIKEYNFIAWDGLPFDINRAPLDASTPNLTFRYNNSSIGGSTFESYNINFYNKIPNDGYPILHKFVDYLYSLEKEENLINSYEEERQ